MKFTVNNESLKDAIERISSTICKHSMVKPYIKLSTYDYNSVTVSFDDLLCCCDITIPADVAEFGNVYLDTDAVKKIYNVPNEVTVSANENSLKSKGAKKGCEISVLHCDFPVHKGRSLKFENVMTISNKNLVSSIDKLFPAVSQDDTREILKGIYFDCENENMVALDGYRMHVVDMAKNDVEIVNGKNFNVSGNHLSYLKKLIQKNDIDKTMTVSLCDDVARFHYENTYYSLNYCISTIQGDYIKYNGIIPKEFSHKFTLDTSELKSVAKEYKGYKNDCIQFFFIDDKMYTYSISNSFRTFDNIESYYQLGHEKDDLSIVFYNTYIYDAMSVLGSGEASFAWNNPISSMVVKKDDMIVLVLPIRWDNVDYDGFKKFISAE